MDRIDYSRERRLRARFRNALDDLSPEVLNDPSFFCPNEVGVNPMSLSGNSPIGQETQGHNFDGAQAYPIASGKVESSSAVDSDFRLFDLADEPVFPKIPVPFVGVLSAIKSLVACFSRHLQGAPPKGHRAHSLSRSASPPITGPGKALQPPAGSTACADAGPVFSPICYWCAVERDGRLPRVATLRNCSRHQTPNQQGALFGLRKDL